MDGLPTDLFIEIKLVDVKTKEETRMRYKICMMMTSTFQQYAKDRTLLLWQLRFTYEGRTLCELGGTQDPSRFRH